MKTNTVAKMTYLQFLKKAAALSEFHEVPSGIRSTRLGPCGELICPLQVVFGSDYYSVSTQAGLNPDVIIDAADDDWNSRPYRRLMEEYLLQGGKRGY